MSKIFITGSSDGLGQLAAKQLIKEGHQVVLHARNEKRAEDAREAVPEAIDTLIGDLSDREATKALADKINAQGPFDAIIHNAGIYQGDGKRLAEVNTFAPYLLTALVKLPPRLIYLSSGLHSNGQAKLEQLAGDCKGIGYGDTKLHILLLTKALARRYPSIKVNAVNPGWVPTKMGGAAAPDDLQKGYETQVRLATDTDATASGQYYFHMHPQAYNQAADDEQLQDEFLKVCERVTGVKIRKQ